MRADLQNLGLILRAAKRFAPGLDAGATASEIRERITEELDYEHEAQFSALSPDAGADTRSSRFPTS